MAIVNADLARWDRLAVIWDGLMPHEQEELIQTALLMAAKNDPTSVPEPQSLRA
jgi:hypothetical protein